MSGFDKWAGDLADHINGKNTKNKYARPKVQTPADGMIDEEVWEYNKENEDADPWVFPCRVCARDHEIGDPEGFDPDMSYCGRSPSCCP